MRILMPLAPRDTPRTSKGSRTRRNDASILDAATALADESGWASMTLARVAERSDLSRMTVKARFADRSAIGAAVWRQRVGTPLTEALREVINACPTPKSGPDATALQSALSPFIEPDASLRAAVELLFVGRYDPAVGPAVAETLGQQVHEALDVGAPGITRSLAAKRAYLICLALGLLAHGRRSPITTTQLACETEKIAVALAAQGRPMRLPQDDLAHVDQPIDFATDDPALERLMRATLDSVGELGYEAATLDVITEAAGCTRGLVFSRYESKHDLFMDASDRMMSQAVRANDAYQREIMAKAGEGVADAAMIREFMKPSRRLARTVSLEQNRLSWHDEQMLAKLAASFADTVWQMAESMPEKSPVEMEAYLNVGLALGLGVQIVADLDSDAWRLPYDVVTVPLLGAN